MADFAAFHRTAASQPLTPRSGDHVSARFTADNQWYRARVKRANPATKKAEVSFYECVSVLPADGAQTKLTAALLAVTETPKRSRSTASALSIRDSDPCRRRQRRRRCPSSSCSAAIRSTGPTRLLCSGTWRRADLSWPTSTAEIRPASRSHCLTRMPSSRRRPRAR